MINDFRITIRATEDRRTTLTHLWIDDKQYMVQLERMTDILNHATNKEYTHELNGSWSCDFTEGSYNHIVMTSDEGAVVQIIDSMWIGSTRTKVTRYFEY